MNKKYKSWHISQGDYEREIDNPQKYSESYYTKLKFRKYIKIFFGIVFVSFLVGALIAAFI